jgi:hypothetical protein
MVESFASACESPDALETCLEELEAIIFFENEDELIQTDFYRIRREERFGLVLRKVRFFLFCYKC